MNRHFSLTLRITFLTIAIALLPISVVSAQSCDWTQVASGTPSARDRSAMVFDEARGETVLWGGILTEFETWAWDGNEWTQVGFGFPPARSRHAMAYDSDRERVVMYGGRDGFQLTLTGTWEWDGSSWTLMSQGALSPLSGTAMAYDKKRRTTIMFGGQFGTSPNDVTNSTWRWDGANWTLIPAGGPSRRRSHAMSYDETRDVIVMHGGVSSGELFLNDTWEWDGTTWTFKGTSGPRTTGHSMTYVPSLGACVLYDAFTSTTANLWLWDGTVWTLLSSETALARRFAVIVADRNNDEIVLQGGSNFDETWVWACVETCYPDCDQSTGTGVLDLFDFLCFQNSFVSGEPYACDCDTTTGPLVCDLFDFLCFQNAFVNGCP